MGKLSDSEIINDWLGRSSQVPTPWTLRKHYGIGWSRATRLVREIRSHLPVNAKPVTSTEKLERHESGGKLSISVESQVPLSPEDLIKKHGLDPDEWELIKFSTRSWDTQYQGRVITLYYSRADLKPRGYVKELRAIIEELAARLPSLKDVPQPRVLPRPDEENLLLINISDIHVGKLYRNPDTGEVYDIDTAVSLYLDAVDFLLERARKGQELARILHIVGNDILHVDHGSGTTKGTPQDTDGHWREAFEAAIEMTAQATLKLARVAPVDILVVPGNHDEEKSVALGYVLRALFKDAAAINVEIPYDPRAFYTWGDVLLGFTHGNNERYDMLPAIMAMHPDWGKTRFHEWHVGHVHHEKEIRYMSVNTRDGVVIHVHPSLTKPDRWHRKRGFVTSLEAAVGYVYNKKLGNIATYRYYGVDAE